MAGRVRRCVFLGALLIALLFAVGSIALTQWRTSQGEGVISIVLSRHGVPPIAFGSSSRGDHVRAGSDADIAPDAGAISELPSGVDADAAFQIRVEIACLQAKGWGVIATADGTGWSYSPPEGEPSAAAGMQAAVMQCEADLLKQSHSDGGADGNRTRVISLED